MTNAALLFFRGLVVLTAFLATSAYAAKPQIQWDEDYDFQAAKTFQWQFTPDTSLVDSEPFMHSRIKNTLEHRLSGWLTEVQSDPDLYVTYHTSSESKIRINSDTYGYGFGGYGYGRWGYYGYGAGGPPIRTSTRVSEYDEGTLVVDLWDASTKQLVWRGSVTGSIPKNVKKVEKEIVKAIERMAKHGRKLWDRAQKEKAKQ